MMSEKISVIIPVKNEASNIGALLEALFSQSRMPDEVVITDGGSVDATRDIIKGYIARGLPIKLIEKEKAFPGEGRNFAAEKSSCSLIAMLDAGLVINGDWLGELAGPLERKSLTQGVYGAYCIKPSGLKEKALAIAYFFSRHRIIRTAPDGSIYIYPTTESLAIRRDVFMKTGGFDTNLAVAEDYIFFNKLKKLNINMAINEKAVVWRPMPVSDLKELFIRAYSNARHIGLAKHPALIFKASAFIPIYVIILSALALSFYMSNFYTRISLFVISPVLFFLFRIFPKIRIANNSGFGADVLTLRGILFIGYYIFVSDIAQIIGYLSGFIGGTAARSKA